MVAVVAAVAAVVIVVVVFCALFCDVPDLRTEFLHFYSLGIGAVTYGVRLPVV